MADLSTLSDEQLRKIAGIGSPTDWSIRAEEIGKEEGLPPGVFSLVVKQESGGNPKAVSKKGAIGLSQLMPNTAKELGIDPNDPEQNLRGGAKYLKMMYDKFGNWGSAFAAYNAGPGAVEKHGGVPPYKETQKYVQSLTSQMPKDNPVSTMTDDELKRIAGIEDTDTTPANQPIDWGKEILGMVRPTLEGAGMLGGAAIGGGAGTLTAPFTGPFGPTAGAITGGGLGYAGGSKVADIIEEFFGAKKPAPLGEQLIETGKKVGEGALTTSYGEGGALVIPQVLKLSGSLIKPIWGRLTGRGKLAIDEALRNSPAFREAVQGKISAEEVVNISKDAVNDIAENAWRDYSGKLQAIKANPQALNAVRGNVNRKLAQLASPDEFAVNIAISPQNEVLVDFADSTLVKNQDVLSKAIKDVVTWQDASAAGLDTLKKRLSTYLNQVEKKSPAEAFLTKLQVELRSGLESSVPGYKEMTRPYHEALDLLRDIDSGLMLKGRGGKMQADQTLRRLMSALKENFELRGTLMNTLSNTSGTDVSGMVAGYAMRDWLPSGLGGSAPFLLGEGVLIYMNPKLWPIVAASSPRIASKFLRTYGEAMRTMKGSQNLFGQWASATNKEVEERNRIPFLSEQQ